MSTESNDSLKAEIDLGVMKVGNQVRTATGFPVAASTTLTTDSNSLLQALAALPIVQPTATAELLTVNAKSTAGVLTTTLVNGSDVTTATKGAFLRVNLTDANGNVTAGGYYLELFTIL